MTCVQSGSLAFTITPKDLTDDLDFVVFDAPKDDCAQKSIIRCVASGMGGGNTNACLGAVGLNFTSTDLSESAGCGGGNDSFVKALDMEKGKTYFVLVNVFNGGINSFYTITFDGTANIATTTETNNLENQDISVYPSIHAQPSFEVGLGQKNISNATLEVFDLAGKSMLQTVLTSEHNHIELPESTKPGLYLIRITQNRQVFYKKFVFAK
jgi:hypothetical protein